jgi:hypothetical protein
VDLRHVGSILRLARIQSGDVDLVHLHVLYGAGRGWISLRAVQRLARRVSTVQRLARRVSTVWTFHDEWPILPGLHVDLHGVVTPQRAATILGTDRPVFRGHPPVYRQAMADFAAREGRGCESAREPDPERRGTVTRSAAGRRRASRSAE